MTLAIVVMWCAAALPFTALAVGVLLRRMTGFHGCCRPPAEGRLWVCAHRRAWVWTGTQWRRILRRRYIRLAMYELGLDIEKAVRGGRKH